MSKRLTLSNSSLVRKVVFSLVVALFLTVSASASQGSGFALIESVIEFFGIQSIQKGAELALPELGSVGSASTTATNAPVSITVSLPDVTATPGTVIIPVTFKQFLVLNFHGVKVRLKEIFY